jgi:hypothetical protein
LFKEAEECLLSGINFCNKFNERAFNSIAHFSLGHVFFEKGDFLRSEEWHGKGYDLIKNSWQFSSVAGWIKIGWNVKCPKCQ